jgi:hypothetical protein
VEGVGVEGVGVEGVGALGGDPLTHLPLIASQYSPSIHSEIVAGAQEFPSRLQCSGGSLH